MKHTGTTERRPDGTPRSLADAEEVGAEDLVLALAEVQVLLVLLLVGVAQLLDALVDLLGVLLQVGQALLVVLRELLTELTDPALLQDGVGRLRQRLSDVALAGLPRRGAAGAGGLGAAGEAGLRRLTRGRLPGRRSLRYRPARSGGGSR